VNTVNDEETDKARGPEIVAHAAFHPAGMKINRSLLYRWLAKSLSVSDNLYLMTAYCKAESIVAAPGLKNDTRRVIRLPPAGCTISKR